MAPGVDPRNRLNNLTNRQWLQETKSFWLSSTKPAEGLDGKYLELFARWLRDQCGVEQAEQVLGQICPSTMWSVTPPRSSLKLQHPATFSEADVERLIRLFTKEGETVLDPFVGTGSTLIACGRAARHGIGIELVPRWVEIARQRLAEEGMQTGICVEILEGDAATRINELADESVHFVVTSPPYWNILGKPAGMKAKAERTSKGLSTRYSDDPADLGNIADYDQFLEQVARILGGCRRVLKRNRYMAVIVSDFRHGPRFYLYHADLAKAIESHGFTLKGITILLQNNKNLYPFGIPYSFVSNIHHQYILIFRR